MLAPLEKAVSLGWGHFVEFIASVHFDASFVNIANMQPLLAQRILSVNDKLPDLAGLTLKQNAAALVFVLLYDLNQCKSCATDIMDAWKAAMTSEQGRVDGRRIMKDTFDHPETFPENIAIMIKHILDDNSSYDLASTVAHCGICGPRVVGSLIDRLT